MYGRAREKQGSMNVITPAHPTLSMEVQENWQLRNYERMYCKRSVSSVAWTYVLQEKWQQRSKNVCTARAVEAA